MPSSTTTRARPGHRDRPGRAPTLHHRDTLTLQPARRPTPTRGPGSSPQPSRRHDTTSARRRGQHCEVAPRIRYVEALPLITRNNTGHAPHTCSFSRRQLLRNAGPEARPGPSTSWSAGTPDTVARRMRILRCPRTPIFRPGPGRREQRSSARWSTSHRHLLTMFLQRVRGIPRTQPSTRYGETHQGLLWAQHDTYLEEICPPQRKRDPGHVRYESILATLHLLGAIICGLEWTWVVSSAHTPRVAAAGLVGRHASDSQRSLLWHLPLPFGRPCQARRAGGKCCCRCLPTRTPHCRNSRLYDRSDRQCRRRSLVTFALTFVDTVTPWAHRGSTRAGAPSTSHRPLF